MSWILRLSNLPSQVQNSKTRYIFFELCFYDIYACEIELKVKENSQTQNWLRNKIKAKISATEFRNIINYVSQKMETLSREMRSCHEKKYKRENISAIESS